VRIGAALLRLELIHAILIYLGEHGRDGELWLWEGAALERARIALINH